MGYFKEQGIRGGSRMSTRQLIERDTKGANIRIDKEVERIIKRLKEFNKYAPQFYRKEILTKAAQPVIEEAQRLAPKEQSGKVRTVYIGKGPNRRKVKFYPGNLKKSIQVLPLKKSPNVWVGPKVVRNAKAASYGKNNRTVNAYYAHWVEYGSGAYRHTGPQPYMRPAYESKKMQVLSILEREVTAMINKWIRENRHVNEY